MRFLFQFRVDAGDQLVRRRCGGFCRKYRRDTEPSAADQHLALFCDAVSLYMCCCVPENSCDFTVLCLPKLCLLRYVSAENTGVPINLPLHLLFHIPIFVIVLGMAEGGFLLPELFAALAVDVRRRGRSVVRWCIILHLLHSTTKAHKITAVIEIHAHR